jgi:2-polyprenyl-6-methoxyphenol hydroxylase-like FAD-dependent oxidoreductase
MPQALHPRTVAIAGAGFAGLTSAALLARAGHQVTVFEKFAQPQSVGAGILVQPTGLAAMRAIGIADAVIPLGARVDHLYGVTPAQRPVVNVRYRDWNADAYGLGLHRASLFNALWKLARDCGVRIETSHEVKDLRELDTAHDLTVVADGARSALRAQTGLACSDRSYPWGAVWAVLEDPDGQYGSTLWQWYRGAHQMLGIMPTGRAPGHDVPVVSLFWSIHEEDYDGFRAAGLEGFRRQVLALNPQCADLLGQLRSPDQLTWARYRDVVMLKYHTDRAVVIGDAAHATSPQLGQGTNLALLDALMLERCLRADVSVAQALDSYTAARRRHLRFYGQASRWMTPGFQSRQRFLPWLRDLLMASAADWPVAGTFCRQTLVGVQQSWWPLGRSSRLEMSDLL